MDKHHRVIALTVSVDYCEMLRLQLPVNARHFDRTVIVTLERDKETAEVCAANGAEVLFVPEQAVTSPTPARKRGRSRRGYDQPKGGRSWNKGVAINHGIRSLLPDEADSWFCHLDSDILLPRREGLFSRSLNTMTLYGCDRADLVTPADLEAWKQDNDYIESMNRVRSKPGFGYFQLFSLKAPNMRARASAGLWYPEEYSSAAGSDVVFCGGFLRVRSLGFTAAHLYHGDHRAMWWGRPEGHSTPWE